MGVVDSKRIIYTPSDFARSSLLHLQEVGSLVARLPHTSARSGLASYLFFIVDEGEGEVEYGGERYHLKRDDCFFIDCRHPYLHRTDKCLWRIRWAHFYGPNMGAIYDKYVSRGGRPVFRAKEADALRAIVDTLYDVASGTGHVKDIEIQERLSALLVLLMQASGYEREDGWVGKTAELQRIKEYLDGHYTEKITLDALQERFFINKYYLLEIFKREYGMGIGQYLIHMRITKSKGLLRFTDKTVEEIAYASGMNSPHYFSRIFKRIEGVSPSEYRKIWVK